MINTIFPTSARCVAQLLSQLVLGYFVCEKLTQLFNDGAPAWVGGLNPNTSKSYFLFICSSQ
jgi:hypothetical protein